MRFIILFLLFAVTGYGQDKKSKLDSFFTKLYKEDLFNGNVLIAEKGNIVYQASFGKADIARNKDNNAETIFELASVSKQFTATAIMLLQREGKLKYTDTLRHFFPELPYHNITIRQILNHTSGLPDYMEMFVVNWDSSKIATNRDMIDLLARHKPAIQFLPGTKWEYSNTGYALLASIVEKVSGKSFGGYLNEKIFSPLAMKNTLVFRRRYENRQLENYAYGYTITSKNERKLPDSLPLTAAMVYCLDGIQGDGVVNSTTNDLLKWDRALYTEKILTKQELAEAFTPAPLPDGKTYAYGFGWGLRDSKEFGKSVSHTGGWPGYITAIVRQIDHDKTIIMLQNLDKTNPSIPKILNILYGIEESAKTEISHTDAEITPYIGNYKLAPEFIITISREGSRIFAQATGQGKNELFKEKDDVFFLKVVDAKIRFERNEKKEVVRLTLLQNGAELPGEKISE